MTKLVNDIIKTKSVNDIIEAASAKLDEEQTLVEELPGLPMAMLQGEPS